MNIGNAVGGPVDGQEISSDMEKITVPVQTGQDRGPGDRGFGSALYRWESGSRTWIYQDRPQ